MSIQKNFTTQLTHLYQRVTTYIIQKPLSTLVILLLMLFLAQIAYMAIWADLYPSWLGFGAYDETTHGPRAKTVWDWMELMFVPAALIVGAFLLNQWQAADNRRLAQDNQRQAALEAYIDRMADLLLRHNSLQNAEAPELLTIARLRTLSILRRLDGGRKGEAFQFVVESRLLHGRLLDLNGADLSQAKLDGASLSHITLKGVNCRQASLTFATLDNAHLDGTLFTEANLHGASFTNASLRAALFQNATCTDANFQKADLQDADLRGATLTGASFQEADLRWANFTGAKVSLSAIMKAKFLTGVVMPNGISYEPTPD